ncbi:MAG: DNA polymerase III subunit gamma/tau [Fimbriimonadaceae bacterium]
MAYLSLYRKYRSQTFSDLMGQDHVVRILQNGIASGRIAHAYLFTGPRGTGKTSSARLLAKALCCETGPTSEPCNTCHICVAITEGGFMDVYEMDAASEAGVDDVREKIVGAAEYRPTIARYKVFIIDEVHDLSPKAFDALLKTLEEPPEHIIFVLATTEFHKVPTTIRSRCQKFEFHRASMQDLVKRLSYVAEAEGMKVEPAAISAIARMADGGFRDALTLLEQAVLTSEDNVTLQHVYEQLGLVPEEVADELLLSMKSGDVPKLMNTLSEVFRLGRDPQAVLESLMYRLADLTRVAYGLDAGPSLDASQDALMHEAAAKVGRETLLSLRTGLAEAHKTVRDISLPRVWLEAELVRLATCRDPLPARKEPAPTNGAKAAIAKPSQAMPPPSDEKAEPTKPEDPPPVAVVVESTGDPELDKAREAWSNTVTELTAMSKSMAMRLTHTLVAKAKANEVTVEFLRNIDMEWVQETPKRTHGIIDVAKKHFGQDLKIHFKAGKKAAQVPEQPAVELPAEGQKLAEMARDILGNQPTSKN